jgi:hypothetical protein
LPNIANLLVEKVGLKPTGTDNADVDAMMVRA